MYRKTYFNTMCDQKYSTSDHLKHFQYLTDTKGLLKAWEYDSAVTTERLAMLGATTGLGLLCIILLPQTIIFEGASIIVDFYKKMKKGLSP